MPALHVPREENYRRQGLLDEVLRRVGDEDVGDLIDLLAQFGSERLIARIQELPWQTHKDRLVAYLRGDNEAAAHSAFRILAQQPELVDVAPLLEEYDRQGTRKKTMYNRFFWLVKKPESRLKELALKNFRDPNAALRFYGLWLVAEAGLQDETLNREFIRLLDDENDCIAAAAAWLAVQRKVPGADAAMLARLKKGVAEYLPGSPEYRQQVVVRCPQETFRGRPLVLVLVGGESPAFPRMGPLAKELIGGLGTLAYKPAAEELTKRLSGLFAVDADLALEKIEPGKHLHVLVQAARSRESKPFQRVQYLELIGKMGRPDLIPELLPLLDDTTDIFWTADDRSLRACDLAAQSIARILRWDDNISPESSRKDREKLIRKIEQWAAKRE